MGEPKLTEAQADPNAFPWKVDDSYPVSVRTPGGETLYFDDLLTEGQKVGRRVMPNQRVVVLTDEEIKTLLSSLPVEGPRRAAQNKLIAALKHPEGITDDQIERQARELHAAICGCATAPEVWCDSIWLVASERGLRAALFPGEDDPIRVGSDENDPSKPGEGLGR